VVPFVRCCRLTLALLGTTSRIRLGGDYDGRGTLLSCSSGSLCGLTLSPACVSICLKFIDALCSGCFCKTVAHFSAVIIADSWPSIAVMAEALHGCLPTVMRDCFIVSENKEA
jgi:hypothetical protein